MADVYKRKQEKVKRKWSRISGIQELMPINVHRTSGKENISKDGYEVISWSSTQS